MSDYVVLSVFSGKPNDKGIIYYQVTVGFPDGRCAICNSTKLFKVGDKVGFEPRLDFKTNKITGVSLILHESGKAPF